MDPVELALSVWPTERPRGVPLCCESCQRCGAAQAYVMLAALYALLLPEEDFDGTPVDGVPVSLGWLSHLPRSLATASDMVLAQYALRLAHDWIAQVAHVGGELQRANPIPEREAFLDMLTLTCKKLRDVHACMEDAWPRRQDHAVLLLSVVCSTLGNVAFNPWE